MHGEITRDLLRCSIGDSVDIQKFLSLHPLTDDLKKDLAMLQRRGLIGVDYGETTIVLIELTQKLLDMAEKSS